MISFGGSVTSFETIICFNAEIIINLGKNHIQYKRWLKPKIYRIDEK